MPFRRTALRFSPSVPSRERDREINLRKESVYNIVSDGLLIGWAGLCCAIHVLDYFRRPHNSSSCTSVLLLIGITVTAENKPPPTRTDLYCRRSTYFLFHRLLTLEHCLWKSLFVRTLNRCEIRASIMELQVAALVLKCVLFY